jgi:hypothetical protein
MTGSSGAVLCESITTVLLLSTISAYLSLAALFSGQFNSSVFAVASSDLVPLCACTAYVTSSVTLIQIC